MADKTSKDELLRTPRLSPAPARPPEPTSHIYAVPAGQVTIDQYLALRQVPEHRRAARRAFAGDTRIATVADFDRIFTGVSGRRV